MANVKFTDLPAIDAVAGADLIAVTDDPTGTPISKKATATQLKTFIESNFSTLALSKGGTGATTAAAARTNLGVGAHPGTTTDNTLARYDGTAGDLQASGVVVSDANEISGYLAAFNDQTGTSYTLLSTDSGKVITLTNANPVTVTLPNSLATGFNITVIQGGAGQVTFSPASGATLNNRSSHTKITGQHGVAALIVTGNSGGSSAVYVLTGDTTGA